MDKKIPTNQVDEDLKPNLSNMQELRGRTISEVLFDEESSNEVQKTSVSTMLDSAEPDSYSSPLSKIPTSSAQSSPLSSVELNDTAIDDLNGDVEHTPSSFKDNNPSEGEIEDLQPRSDDERKASRRNLQREKWEKKQIEQYKFLELGMTRLVTKARSDEGKSSPVKLSIPFAKCSSATEKLANLPKPTYFKSGSDDSGATTPLETDEGLVLPGRRKPVPFSQDRAGRTLIFKYAKSGDLIITEALLRAGASLRIADHAGWTPLHEACLEGHEKIVELLMSYDADIDAAGGDGDTPLHDAVGNSHFKVVELLLKNGASLRLHNEEGQTAEEFAIEKLELIKENARSVPGDTENSTTNLEADAKAIVDILKEWRIMTKKVVERNDDGQTIFHIACSEGNVDRALKLIEFGADITAVDNSGWAPIHNACINGHHEVVAILLRYGSEVDPLGMHEETPLHDAVANGHVKCASLLLEYGAEPFRKNRNGKMARDLMPSENREMRDLLDHPLEFWQPVKTPAFYPRLLVQFIDPVESSKEKESKPIKEKPAVKRKEANDLLFPWGALEAKGSFESSREEKKFHALLKTLSRSDVRGDITSSVTEKSASNRPGRRNSVNMTPAVPLAPQESAESAKSATLVEKSTKSTEPAKKKKRTSESVEQDPKRQKPLAAVTRIPVKEKSTDKLLDPHMKKAGEKDVIEKGTPGLRPPIGQNANNLEQKRMIKVAPKIKKPPAPVSKLHLAIAELSKEDVEKLSKKKKRGFAISGYQAAGESSASLVNSNQSSENVLHLGKSEKSDIIPSSEVKHAEVPARKLSILSGTTPKSPSFDNILKIVEQKVKKDVPKKSSFEKLVNSAQKMALQKKLCLPLCAFVKANASSPYFKPVNISREGLWGDLPKHDHTKVFVDMQLAFCLGLSSGRQLLEKYPSLDSRVATTVEKTAMEATIVSHRIFSTMHLTMDPAWIQSTTIDGLQSLKLAEVDIHIIFWSEELFRILNAHIFSIESGEKISLDWIEDQIWPVQGEEPKEVSVDVVSAKSFAYVHKLKRHKMG